MKIARHYINFKESFKVTALFVFQLFLHSILNLASKFVFLEGRLRADYFVVLVDPYLVELPHDICLVSAHNILNVQ